MTSLGTIFNRLITRPAPAVRDHMRRLSGEVFGNPHSKNLTSLAMTALVERTRESVLRYFNASPHAYMVIFTPNATGGAQTAYIPVVAPELRADPCAVLAALDH